MKKALNFTMTDFFLIFVTFFVAFIYLMGRSQAPIQISDIFDQDYSMPRPVDQTPNSSFDLSGYKLNKNKINPFENKQPVPQNTNLTARGTPVKKAEAPKKAAAKAKKTADKKPQLTVDVVGEDRQTMSEGDIESNQYSVVTSYQNYVQPASPQTAAKKQTEEEALTKEEWVEAFENDGSQKEVSQLVKDLNAGRITEVQFYEIVEGLLKNNSEEKQSLGLFALSSVVKSKSFELMAVYQTQMNEKLAAQFQVAMQAYSSLTRLALLNKLAEHTEEVVVIKAIEIIDYAARAWLQMTTDQLNQRRIASTDVSKYFLPIVTTLQKQGQNPNQAIAQAAQQALKEVESLIAKSKE